VRQGTVSDITKALTDPTPKCSPRADPRPPFTDRIQDKIAWKPG